MKRATLHQRRAQETRGFILDAAYRVVGRKGYGEATVEEIAAEAGVSMGALYYHFPSKEQLFKSLLHEHVHRTLHSFEEMPSPTSLHEAIDLLVSFWLNHIRAEAESRPLMMEFWAQATRQEWAHAEVSASLQQLRDVIAAMVRMGQEAGVVRADLDIDTTAFLIVSVLEGVSLQQALDADGVDLDVVKRPLADFIERFIWSGAEADPREGERQATEVER